MRIAILSLLFNWPSKGGGATHTAELVRFLTLAGYRVRHIFATHVPWQIGNISTPLPYDGYALELTSQEWTPSGIQNSFRRAVDEFSADVVLITDCWNFKPWLAEAMAGYRVIWRMQAQEDLCPLNNLRLITDGKHVRQCGYHQLVNRTECLACLKERGSLSGWLHQSERALSAVDTPRYNSLLSQTLRQAEAVLVLNRQIKAHFEPHVNNVQVVPWGMDPTRFPATPTPPGAVVGRPLRLLFAGIPQEGIKGLEVLHSACHRLWMKRRDFELLVTGEPAEQVAPWVRSIGWQAQSDLPAVYMASDIVVVPTVAQDGLSRVSVEAMACARPVIASDIGGLPETVTDGVTGLLVPPGDPEALSERLNDLMDHPIRRTRLGQNGRHRFEACFTWQHVVTRYYIPLFGTSHWDSTRIGAL